MQKVSFTCRRAESSDRAAHWEKSESPFAKRPLGRRVFKRLMRDFVGKILLAAVLTTCAVSVVHANAVSALASGENLHCVPALRYFCANVHIGCAGRSKERSFNFTLQVYKERARIVPAAAAAQQRWQGRLTGQATFEPNDGFVVMRLGPLSEYLKVTDEGRFNMRQRDRGRTLMTYGRCR